MALGTRLSHRVRAILMRANCGHCLFTKQTKMWVYFAHPH
jgi:hypothetical protein